MEAIFAYVGCFSTEKRRAHGDGIHVYRVDPKTGACTHVQHVGGLINPSWLTLNPSQTALYSAHADHDYVTAFSIDRETGHLTLLNTGKAGGRNGVRTMVDRSERFLAIANHQSGNIAILPINPDGSVCDCVQAIDMPGSPRHLHRSHDQESSRPHDSVFDPSGQFIIFPDKGLDRLFVFGFDPDTGRLTPADVPFTRTRNAAGPRHITFHPRRPLAWVVNELDSTIATYRWDANSGTLTALDVALTLPGDFTGDSWTAEIAFLPSSQTIYISNRGHDSITIFRVNKRTGFPRPTAWVPTGGKQPRSFAIEPTGKFLYAANQSSDSIVAFHIDPQNGSLRPTGQIIPNASPTTIIFSGGRN